MTGLLYIIFQSLQYPSEVFEQHRDFAIIVISFGFGFRVGVRLISG